jgi:hypothetical protein
VVISSQYSHTESEVSLKEINKSILYSSIEEQIISQINSNTSNPGAGDSDQPQDGEVGSLVKKLLDSECESKRSSIISSNL